MPDLSSSVSDFASTSQCYARTASMASLISRRMMVHT